MPAILKKSTSNAYSLESYFAKLASYIDQSVTKASSPQFKGLTITQGPLIVDGDIQYTGDINRVNSEISTFVDFQLRLGVDSILPLVSGEFAIARGGILPDASLTYTASTSQWSLFDGVTTGSIAHFQDVTTSTTTTNQSFPITLNATTGSLVPTTIFQVPLTFQESLFLDPGYQANLNLGNDSNLNWTNGTNLIYAQLGLSSITPTQLELRNATDFVLRDGSNLNIALGSHINISNPSNFSSVYAYIGSQTAGLASAAASGGVDLILNSGLAATGGTILVPSSLDSPDRSAITIQGGQYLNRGLTFGPADIVGTNAPRLYTLSCPTMNTLIPFGKEFTITPALSSLNTITSAELNVNGIVPAVRLTTSLNNTCFNVAVNNSQTTSSVTTIDFEALNRSSGATVPLAVNWDVQQTNVSGSVSIAEDLTVEGQFTQQNGIDATQTLTASNLFQTNNVSFPLVAIQIPSVGWRLVTCTFQCSSAETTSTVPEPFGFDLPLPDRNTSLTSVGDVAVTGNNGVSFDPTTSFSRQVQITVVPLPNSTSIRVTLDTDDTNLVCTGTLSLLYQAI